MMRHKIISYSVVLLSFFAFTNCAGTQDLAPDGSKIPYEVNTIIINTDMTENEAFKAIGKHFIQEGYTIKNSSPEFSNVTTEFKEAPAGALQASVDVRISASVVTENDNTKILLNGTLRQGMQTSSFDIGESTIKQKGQSGSPMRVAWDEFYSVAKSFSDNLSFEKR